MPTSSASAASGAIAGCRDVPALPVRESTRRPGAGTVPGMQTTDTSITDVASLVDGYIAAWNATDPARRRELVGLVFSDDASYLDPLMQGDGAEAIDALIAGAQAQFPGHRFELAGRPDDHHDRVRFTWRLRSDGGEGEPVAIGIDFATLAPDGRMRAVTGFLEQP